jgi:hypothetical protein
MLAIRAIQREIVNPRCFSAFSSLGQSPATKSSNRIAFWTKRDVVM